MSNYMNAYCNSFGYINTLQLGLQMLDSLQQLHSIGFIHQDLKPPNICIGNFEGSDTSKVYLIDMGLATQYTKKKILRKPVTKEEHIKEGDAPQHGNIAFGSLNSLSGKQLSRRDDIISLAYLLLYCLTREIPHYKTIKGKSKGGL